MNRFTCDLVFNIGTFFCAGSAFVNTLPTLSSLTTYDNHPCCLSADTEAQGKGFAQQRSWGPGVSECTLSCEPAGSRCLKNVC